MIENPLVILVVFPVAAYLIGSTPCGVIIAHFHGADLRKSGSGNVGATNVGRVLGSRWGYLCFFLDVIKGLVPVVAAGVMMRSLENFPTLTHQAAWLAVGFGAIAGHVFSFYLKFRGGKGVATGLGVMLGIFPYLTWTALSALGLWIVVVLIWRYVSLASIAAAVAFPLLFTAFNWPLLDIWPLAGFALAMSAMIIIRHIDNIKRLVAGTESKIGKHS